MERQLSLLIYQNTCDYNNHISKNIAPHSDLVRNILYAKIDLQTSSESSFPFKNLKLCPERQIKIVPREL